MAYLIDQQIIKLWLHGKRQLSQKSYTTDIEQFFEIVRKPIQELSLKDIQDYIDNLESLKYKASTQTRKINAVKSILGFAVEQGHIAKNPAAAIKLKALPQSVAGKILTREQVEILIASAESQRDRVFLLVLYGLALRLSEACSLKWSDFIQQDVGKWQVMVNGKGGKIAPVVVPTAVWQALQTIRGDDDRVFGFCDRTGHDVVKTAVRNSGLDAKISAHWLRHSHASHAIRSGADLALVRDTLRHASISTTNCYLHSFPGESSGSYLGLDEPLFGDSGAPE